MKEVNHILGSTRTIRTTVMVTEYLRERYSIALNIPGSDFKYRFRNPNPENGFWSADILVTFRYDPDDKESMDRYLKSDKELYNHNLVDVVRAFVAGAGEIWT